MYYVDKTKATISASNGRVELKVQNLNFVTRARIRHLNSRTQYWKDGEIGFNTTVGSLSWQKISPTSSPEMLGATSSPYEENYGKTKVVNPNKADGTPDGRFKERSVNTASAKSAKGARGMLIIDAINTSLDLGIKFAFINDADKISEHAGLLGNAVQDLNNALGQGMIPEEYQNADGMSAILNFVFQSDNVTNDKNIGVIGQRIINEISKKEGRCQMKIKLKFYIILLFCIFNILGCNKNSLEDKLIGIWTVDITAVEIEKNNWSNIYGNVFSLKSDFTCEALPFKNVITEEFYEPEGIWLIISNDSHDSIFFNVPDHPMNGKYKIELYKDIDRKLLKMKLSNDSIEFTCSKFLQNFDSIKNW